MTDKSFSSKRFRNIGVLTIASVYFLILVGGIVRSTGSGMGCPDWPKCFGSWVPPTRVEQLPDNYLEVYRDKRIQKNDRLAGTLQALGFQEAAMKLRNNPLAQLETEFNVRKTWIEYVNRLVGVLIGIFIFLTVLFSFSYFRKDNAIVYLSVLSFLLVGFQGWLGSIVVSTNLLPVTITIHMALALVLVGLLIYAVARSQASQLRERVFRFSRVEWLVLWGVVLLSFVQILLGTQVREMVDQVAFDAEYRHRETWISQLDTTFLMHRSFSWVVLAFNLYLVYRIFRLKDGLLNRLGLALVFLLALEIIIGVGMAWYGIPPVLQPLHLLVGSLVFGVQFLMLIIYYYATRYQGVARIVA